MAKNTEETVPGVALCIGTVPRRIDKAPRHDATHLSADFAGEGIRSVKALFFGPDVHPASIDAYRMLFLASAWRFDVHTGEWRPI